MWRLEQMAFIIDIPDNWSPFVFSGPGSYQGFMILEGEKKSTSKILISQAVCQTAVSHHSIKSAINQSCFLGKVKLNVYLNLLQVEP